MSERTTITEAILAVMREAGVPLSAREAYRRIVEKQLYEFHAQQPEYIVIGQIRRHCKDLNFHSSAPTKYFGMTNEGKFYPLQSPLKVKLFQKERVRAKPKEKITIDTALLQIRKLQKLHRELIKDRILSEIRRISPVAFEKFARRLLEVYGFEHMKVTSVSKDGGIDGYGKLKIGLAYMNIAFQCKRWNVSNVGRPEIDKFRGAIQGEYEQGIFFTTAKFASGAKEISFKPGAVPVILIDGQSIVELMIEKNFGVEQESLPIYSYALDLIISGDDIHRIA